MTTKKQILRRNNKKGQPPMGDWPWDGSAYLEHTAVDGVAAEHFFNAEELVVFADAISTGE